MTEPGPAHGDDPTAAAAAAEDQVFIARQPIFDARTNVHAYELLFRAGLDNQFGQTDGDAATLHVLNNIVHLMGLSTLTNGVPAFVNFTRRLLLEDAYTLLPPEGVVIEVLEDVEPDQPVQEACRRLKEAGYSLALDDCIFADRHNPLWAMADVIKIDFAQCSEQERRLLAEQCRARGVAALAEKVETAEQLQEAQRVGYTYFQGYFFSRPQVQSGRTVRIGQQSYLEFLRQINAPELSYDDLEQCIRQDATLSYKLLRYLNSAAIGLRQKVTSIHQALTLLGGDALRKWGSLIAMTSLAADKPNALLTSCLVRARLCERISEVTPTRQAGQSLFIMGLLSGLHAAMDRPMRDVLQDVAIDDAIRDALLGKPTPLGQIYALAQSCERGDWSRITRLCQSLKVELRAVARIQQEALSWADQTLKFAA